MKKVMSISSVVLILAGFIIGLVVSQSSSRFVQEAEAAENTASGNGRRPSPPLRWVSITPALKR